jgi:hypothetical protein
MAPSTSQYQYHSSWGGQKSETYKFAFVNDFEKSKFSKWRHDTQPNDTQQNDIRHNNTQHKGVICDT